MTIPSRVLGSGVNSMSTVAICGDGGTGLTATGTQRRIKSIGILVFLQQCLSERVLSYHQRKWDHLLLSPTQTLTI
mgnify:CR=1 FL=1